MYVRRAALDRVQQHFIDEPHNRRILDVIAVLVGIRGFLVLDVQVLEVEVIVVQGRHAGIYGFDRLVNAFFQLVLFNDYRVDTQAGRESDFVNCLQVCRVCNADEYALAALDQWQHAKFADEFLVDRADDFEVDFNRVEVKQRYAELV